MKKLTYIFGCLTLALASCGSPDSGNKTETASTAENNPATAENNTATAESGGVHKGKQLIEKSDCLGCHNETTKVVGPAYVEVAAKYPMSELNVDELADKIIRGGNGVWGEVPMTPHPNLSKEDAKEMVNYILSLKK
jgi:cytochrome c